MWSWLPANGHSGGILLGVRHSTLEVGALDQGEFFLSASIFHRASRAIFQYIGVYGPADHTRSAIFLEELERKITSCQYPVLISSDFNLIRGPRDKNNNNINWPKVRLFNDFIARLSLREIERTGAILLGQTNSSTQPEVFSTGSWCLQIGIHFFP